MNWTAEAPKQDGWYWWRQDERDPAECVEVARALGAKQSTAWMVGEPDDRSITGIGGEWLGPLDPAQLLNLNNVSTTSPSYESLVKELRLTRLALDEERERCARIAINQAEAIRVANTYRGKVNQMADQAAFWCEQIAAEIINPPNPVITIPNTEQPST